MYGYGSSYRSRHGYGSSNSHYPGYSTGRSYYGSSSSSPSRYRYNFGYGNSSPPRNNYFYGHRRRRPYSWERDSFYWRNRWMGLDERESTPEPEPSPEPPKEEIVKELLVKDIDFNIQENVKNNHTDAFECTDEDREGDEPELVVRRGNFMKLTVKFDRPYQKEKHDLKLCFTIGKTPSSTKGTMEQFPIDEDGEKRYDPNTWGAYLESCSDNEIVIMVHIAANSIIGEWNLAVKSFSEGKDKDGKETTLVLEYKHHDDIYILFNPWCKEDGVYMKDTELLKEYVDNEQGCVYRGSHDNYGAKAWNYGQFEAEILDISLSLLRKVYDGKISKDMANPVLTARKLVQILNSSDDDGVLVGNWSGNYSDGVSPSSWNGTPAILKQFNKSGSVKYGQCWVFACLTTTVCRCLGIPCRTITNFLSAHDSEQSNSIEKFVWEQDGKLEKYPYYGNDSVWNFHVWNEVWMRRPDAGNLDGWQAIDATPQEPSEGLFTCGPCPVEAVKQGSVDVPYDTAFVFSEVGADECTFKVLPDYTIKLLSVDKTKIGKKISTKVPDGRPFKDYKYNRLSWREKKEFEERRRCDVTNNYKYPEGSAEEREAVKKAYSMAKFYIPDLDPYFSETAGEKVTFEMNYNPDLLIGSDLRLEILAKNEGDQPREIMYVHLQVAAETYTGEPGAFFFERIFEAFNLDAGQVSKFDVLLTAEEYFNHLIEQANLYIEVTSKVYHLHSSGEPVESIVSTDLRFRRPDLDVEGPEFGRLREPVDFVVSFKNPAPVPLTNCYMSMGSSGFRDVEAKSLPDVGVGDTYRGTFTMIPKRKREHEVNFTFECDELKDIAGSTSIEISKV